MGTDRTATGAAGVRGFAPCFPVRDLRAALAHYRQLGFEAEPYAEGMTWARVRLGPAALHLFVKSDHDPATTAAAADLRVDNADEFVHVLRPTTAGGTSDPYDTPTAGSRARRSGPQPDALRHPGRGQYRDRVGR